MVILNLALEFAIPCSLSSGCSEQRYSCWHGNKIEDFGVGFYTKYGDCGVDISPIADCNKTEIWEIGKELGILKEIIEAAPTDGLWDDGRTDEGQLGLKYHELEEAMDNPNSPNRTKYETIRKQNLHKMEPIPVCKIPN